MLTHPLARVTGCRDKTRVGGEPLSAREGADVTYGYQELLGPEDRPHARQASENPSLRTGEKTLPKLLVEGVDALLEAEDIFGEFGDDCAAATSCAGRVRLSGPCWPRRGLSALRCWIP